MDRPSGNHKPTALEELQLDIRGLIDEFSPSWDGEMDASVDPSAWIPKLDILETNAAFRLRIDLPGVDRGSLAATAEGNRFTIRGERPEPKHETRHTLHGERPRGTFYRSLTLPADVNPDAASAKFENGVLLVDLPKGRQGNTKSIAIS